MSLRDNPYAPEDPLAKAWSRGYIAGREGMAKSSCEYKPRAGRFCRAWAEGWQAGLVAFQFTRSEKARVGG
jgi:ribosome modulation factor